jgi:hypothetical protein
MTGTLAAGAWAGIGDGTVRAQGLGGGAAPPAQGSAGGMPATDSAGMPAVRPGFGGAAADPVRASPGDPSAPRSQYPASLASYGLAPPASPSAANPPAAPPPGPNASAPAPAPAPGAPAPVPGASPYYGRTAIVGGAASAYAPPTVNPTPGGRPVAAAGMPGYAPGGRPVAPGYAPPAGVGLAPGRERVSQAPSGARDPSGRRASYAGAAAEPRGAAGPGEGRPARGSAFAPDTMPYPAPPPPSRLRRFYNWLTGDDKSGDRPTHSYIDPSTGRTDLPMSKPWLKQVW